MKISKKLISKTKYVLLSLLITFSFSCSPEDGADGAVGPAGANGIDGTNGEDGNANVQIYTFDLSSESGINMFLDIPDITSQMVEDNVILVSYTISSGSIYMAPGPGYASTYQTKVFFEFDELYLGFRNYDGTFYTITEGDILSARVFIIEPNIAAKTSSKKGVLDELEQAGVDINDYYAVCDYYGITY